MALEFKDIELSDKEWVDPLLALSSFRGTEYCFTSLFVWASHYGTKIGRHGDFLLIRSESEEAFHYIFPAGQGDLAQVLLLMEEDAASHGKRFELHVSMENIDRVREVFPDRYVFTPMRNSFDYIYDAQALITLSGKKYQPKRNFISRFKQQQDWQYESFSFEDPEAALPLLQECKAMNDEWCRINGCIHNESMMSEGCAVRNAMRNFVALGLRGGLLRVDGRVVAFTIGEPIGADTFIVHIEKAFSDVTGAYPMINQSFLVHEAQGAKYVNREDDAGDEGLRKAKLSYNPAFMLEKYLGIRI